MVAPRGGPSGCATGARGQAGSNAPYIGNPPLLNHGGPVMSTPSVGSQVTVTPIYWIPAGFGTSANYQTVINQYIADAAADSGKTTNVYATMTQYPGSNGALSYKMVPGAPIVDTTAFPASGCTVNGGGVYADNSGYSVCLSDSQMVAELNAVIAAQSLPTDLGHLYVMQTPKGVESCFYDGNPFNQACSVNSSPSAAYCGYHSYAGNAIYAVMPYPIYQSPTGYSCTEESLGAGNTIQSPNGDADADVEISILSHEIAEAITDPNLNAWYDASGNENGDDCAYLYGALSGSDGGYYNQTIHGGHYLTQMEFSNDDFVPNVSGCIQQEEARTPQTITFTSSPPAGAMVGDHYTVTATGGGSGNPVTFSAPAYESSICTLVDNGDGSADVTFVGNGTCAILARQAGNATYDPAPLAKQKVKIRAPQAITFTSTPPSHAVVGDTYNASATGGGSGLPVRFSTTTPSICSVTDNGDSTALVSFTAEGSCVLRADQSGNAMYSSAPNKKQKIRVFPAPVI